MREYMKFRAQNSLTRTRALNLEELTESYDKIFCFSLWQEIFFKNGNPKKSLVPCSSLRRGFPTGPAKDIISSRNSIIPKPSHKVRNVKRSLLVPPAQSSHHGSGVSRKLYLWVTGSNHLITICTDIQTSASDCQRRQASWLKGHGQCLFELFVPLRCWEVGEQKLPNDPHAVRCSLRRWPAFWAKVS